MLSLRMCLSVSCNLPMTRHHHSHSRVHQSPGDKSIISCSQQRTIQAGALILGLTSNAPEYWFRLLGQGISL